VRYRKIGRWGLRVSEIALGSWLTFGGSVGEDTATECIHRAFDLGVNLFDTANVYAEGLAEQIIGRALGGLPRGQVVVATKVFGPMGEGPNERGLSRKHVVEQCDASLARLATERIDLYQCHRFDPDTPLDEVCGAMDDLIRQGKVLYWGVSEWTVGQLREADALCRREGLHPPVANQPRYSMLARDAEQDVLAVCAELGLGVLAFSPLAQGVLTGKYRSASGAPSGSRAAHAGSSASIGRLLTAENLARVEELRPIAAELGCSLGQLALAWVLRRGEISSVIVGASSPRQIEESAEASGLELESSVLERIGSALG
jgi:voltage-dependent potassium channel beta subunit